MTSYIGTAAWNLPSAHRDLFPEGESVLARYSQVFNAVEINSSFYKDHQPGTYARWAQTVDDDFRFSVKLSKKFTHQDLLRTRGPALRENLKTIFFLGGKLGVILVQLPPRLGFEPSEAVPFFTDLRKYYGGPVALEPRHADWLTTAARNFLRDLDISRVSADPDLFPEAEDEKVEPFYFRWHGSPSIYKSAYSTERIRELAAQLRRRDQDAWCIFDNTALGHATTNAVELAALLADPPAGKAFVRSAVRSYDRA